MIQHRKRYWVLLSILLIQTLLFGNFKAINIEQTDGNSILPYTRVATTDDNATLASVIKSTAFKSYNQNILNLGISQKRGWIAFVVQNHSDRAIHRLLIPTSSLLEDLVLYDGQTHKIVKRTGLMHLDSTHNTLFFHLPITLQPHSSRTYYLSVHSTYSPVAFKLLLEDSKTFYHSDKYRKAFNILLIGIVLSLMLYAFFISLYMRDRSYFYYGLYLFTLLFQQITYIGLTKIYFPPTFVTIDLEIVLLKIGTLIVTSALFAIHFLNTKQVPWIDRTYKGFILLTLFEIILFHPQSSVALSILIITGAFFVTYQLLAGIIIYRKGYTQARLFIMGFALVFPAYLFLITDALGITTFLVDFFNNSLILVTVIEAFILSLAFADRYLILEKEKQQKEKQLTEETLNRTRLVEEEVKKKTEALNQSLHTQELLLKEVHHRVKNNLQIILSMIRLQYDEIEDPKIQEKFINLEHRINTIAKTYSMLLSGDDLENINIATYIDALLYDISESYSYTRYSVEVISDIGVHDIPLKQAVYIGLVINELVTNAYKYAFKNGKGIIRVSLHKEEKTGEYLLIIEDNGSGYSIDKNKKSLGLRLIHALIYDQLEGSMQVENDKHTKYTIRFKV